MRLHLPISGDRLLVGVALLPVLGLWLFGGVMVMPPLWVHFYGVGVSALAAAAAALVLMTIGARRGDARTVVIAGGFTIMAAILAVHGLVTPGVLVGQNGVIALTGAATLPVGAAVLALSTLAVVNERRSIPILIALVAAVVAIILTISLVGVLVPRLVPSVPDARSPAAWALLALGLFLFGALAIRAANTYLLTRRIADLAVVVGLVLLACSLFGALALTFMDLGWWVGHVFELVGIGLVGASVAYDLRRGSQSRPLVGDLRASEVVSAEEAFLGARVRAIMVRLAEKDSSTEEHTRRVAALAVEVGEALGLSGRAFATWRSAVSCTTSGSSRFRARSCRSQARSTTTSSRSSSSTPNRDGSSSPSSAASTTASDASSSTITSGSTAAAIRAA